eukprot:1103060-Rhodomonas_salina.2
MKRRQCLDSTLESRRCLSCGGPHLSATSALNQCSHAHHHRCRPRHSSSHDDVLVGPGQVQKVIQRWSIDVPPSRQSCDEDSSSLSLRSASIAADRSPIHDGSPDTHNGVAAISATSLVCARSGRCPVLTLDGMTVMKTEESQR